MIRALIIRALDWLDERERRSRHHDDAGAVTSEYLMLTALAAGIIGLIVIPRMEGILGGVLDAIDQALPG